MTAAIDNLQITFPTQAPEQWEPGLRQNPKMLEYSSLIPTQYTGVNSETLHAQCTRLETHLNTNFKHVDDLPSQDKWFQRRWEKVGLLISSGFRWVMIGDCDDYVARVIEYAPKYGISPSSIRLLVVSLGVNKYHIMALVAITEHAYIAIDYNDQAKRALVSGEAKLISIYTPRHAWSFPVWSKIGG